jgi:type II secretory pathway component PulF
MALYIYNAFSTSGKKVSGQLDAASVQNVREQLTKMRLYPISIELASQAKSFRTSALWAKLTEKPVPLKDRVLFTKQLAILLRSGVPLLQALELLYEQFDGQLKKIIISLKDGIKEGQSLAVGMAQYPMAFSTIYVQLVRAGEATGKLEMILDRLTDFLEREAELKKRVSGALRGPLINLAIIFAISIFLLTVVVPKIGQTLSKFGESLPLNTRILLSMSEFITTHYILLFACLAFLVIGWMVFARSAYGRLLIDRVKLRIPIMKFFTRMTAVVQFSSTLGMLLEGGVNLPEALDIVCKIIDNKVLATSLMAAREKIVKEGKITQYLKQTGIFPPMAIYLINTGEQSGKLDSMLLAVAKNYESDLLELSDKLADQIQPFMMALTAGLVGFIGVSILQPMMNLNEMISSKFS